MAEAPRSFPHLFLPARPYREDYISPRGYPRLKVPPRDRARHAAVLLAEIEKLTADIAQIETFPRFDGNEVIRIEVSGEVGFDLNFESLELKRRGIQVQNVTSREGREIALLRVPRISIGFLLERIIAYRDQETPGTQEKPPSPRYKKLVETISTIRRAHARSLWTDTPEQFPGNDEAMVWWEVWLEDTPKDTGLASIREFAGAYNLRLGEYTLRVFGYSIVLLEAPLRLIGQAIEQIGEISELRKAKELANDFLNLEPTEQGEWIRAALGLIDPPAVGAPAVCLFDTGVNRAHPLLAPGLDEADMHAVDAAWGTHDHEGHGSQMAGVALYGDLLKVILSTQRKPLLHKLESVKILPPVGANPPELYGAVTIDAVKTAYNSNRVRRRAFCMAVTTTDFRDRGQPTSWSAAVDNLCYGVDGIPAQLFLVSAGNVDKGWAGDYPNRNRIEGIHDPAHAWNALTVGACTSKIQIPEASLAGYLPVAPAGDLSPFSSTSHVFSSKWPNKPDVVIEGGNGAVKEDLTDTPDSLSILTTSHIPASPFTATRGTSPAVASVADLAADLQARYPASWPETIRGLVVHSADWTEAMKARHSGDVQGMLRSYGYGIPNYEKAISSAENRLTLLVQGDLQPFIKGKMKDINLHNLPWPKDILKTIADHQVELRVTLSYFIQPNPGRRGWRNKFSYQSHALRFEVKKATETATGFLERVNAARRSEEGTEEYVGDNEWSIGWANRSRGSVHSDRWRGTAADLISRDSIAVFPVMGWWRHNPVFAQSRSRYSLIASLHVPEVEVDVYTPVANRIAIEIERGT